MSERVSGEALTVSRRPVPWSAGERRLVKDRVTGAKFYLAVVANPLPRVLRMRGIKTATLAQLYAGRVAARWLRVFGCGDV